jgi:hypothetical protein
MKLLEFLIEFRNSGFENCYNIPKQISTGLETGLKFIDHCVSQKAALFFT